VGELRAALRLCRWHRSPARGRVTTGLESNRRAEPPQPCREWRALRPYPCEDKCWDPLGSHTCVPVYTSVCSPSACQRSCSPGARPQAHTTLTVDHPVASVQGSLRGAGVLLHLRTEVTNSAKAGRSTAALSLGVDVSEHSGSHCVQGYTSCVHAECSLTSCPTRCKVAVFVSSRCTSTLWPLFQAR
jgi:hypothetical protein